MPLDDLGLPEDTLKALKDFPSMFNDMQKALESKNEATVKNIESQFEKIEAACSELNKKHAEIEGKENELSELRKSHGDQEKRIAELELQIAKGMKVPELGDPNDPDSVRKAKRTNDETYDPFFEWLKKGDDADIDHKQLALNIKSTLRTDRDVAGGFLLPDIMDTELRKDIREVSPVRMFARSRPMPSKTMEVPRRSQGIIRAAFEGEAEEGSTGISKYVNEQVTCFSQTHTVPATKDMLYSSAFDLESEIMSDVMEAFAAGEGYNFLHGTGLKSPKGIIPDTRVGVVDTAATGVLDWVDFATIVGQLKKGQNPWFFFNRVTLSEIWKLKDNEDRPIWMPIAVGGTAPATIMGYPYNSDMIDLDDHVPTTSNTKPVIFGDLRRGYEIFDMAGVEVIRDDYTQKTKRIIEWTFHRFLTGQVILAEAIKVMKIK